MTGVSRGNIIALGLVFVILPLLLTRCSTVEHKWKEVNNHPRKTPYIFNRFNPVGTGLRTTPSGYMTKACLEKIDTSVSGGVMAVEFHKIDDSFVESIDKSVMELKKDLLEENGSSSNVIKKYDNPDLNNFIVESYKRSRRLNLLKRKPLSFMLSIKVADREITLKEETAKFRPDVLELIKDENVKGFLYTCGTDYIHAISMDSYIYFFITYYVPPEKEKKIEKMISRNISENPENTFQINIFEDIDIDFDTYFSLHLETDSVFEPAEFTFSKFHGRSIDTFLSRIVYSVLSSNRGVIKDYTMRPWRKLNEARKLATEGFTVSPMASPEEPVFKSLRQLEDSVRDFRNTLLFWGKIKNWNNKKRVARCRKLLKQEARRINWEQFYSCSKSALKKYEVNLSIVPECRPMIEAIANINVDRNCTRIHYRELPGQDPLNRKIYTPLELTVIPQKGAESLFTDDGEYRFDDKRQVEELPPEIKPGQTIDYTGKLYSGECFKKKSIKYCEAYPKRDQVVATNFYPHSFKKANWFLRALFFWKDLPKQVIYRGSYEVVGYTKRMLPNFTLTDKALKLAELDLKEFYKKYGTHYVSQVKHRRGFVYYFIVNTTGDDDDEYIELKPYGVSKYIELGIPGAQGGQGVPGMDQGGGCLFGLFGSSSKVENPLFEPKTVKEFFNNREKLINLYQNDKKAVPVSLSLEPWSEYLKEKGILRPHQLDLK